VNPNGSHPVNVFEELPNEKQRVVVDVTCAMSVLIVRLPKASHQLMGLTATEVARHIDISLLEAGDALRTCGKKLFNSDWSFHITKEGPNVTTKFQPVDEQLSEKPPSDD